MPKRAQFLTVDVALTQRNELLGTIDGGETVRIATLNPEFMLEAEKNESFRSALNSMTHCTVDGFGLLLFLKLKGIHAELYHGADLAEDLFRRYQDGSKSFFLLGGRSGLAHNAAQALHKKYPSIRIVGATDGGTIDPAKPLDNQLVEEIRNVGPDILLVGFGAPKQELWIQAAHELPVQVMVGVGGTFGFYTTKKRAPQLWRELHLEWLYRSFTEKGHFRRAFKAVVLFPLRALSK